MKLKSMKLSDKQQEQAMPSTVAADRPKYPWGLGLHLDDEIIKKLELGGVEVGKTLMVQARVNVTGAMEQEHEHSGKQRSVSLQITDMAIGTDEGEGDAADKLYDGPK